MYRYLFNIHSTLLLIIIIIDFLFFQIYYNIILFLYALKIYINQIFFFQRKLILSNFP